LVKETNLNPYYLSVQPPSIEVLEQRLRGRGTETEEALQARLAAAQGELDYANEEGAYDETIVNDNLEVAYAKFKDFINRGNWSFLCSRGRGTDAHVNYNRVHSNLFLFHFYHSPS